MSIHHSAFASVPELQDRIQNPAESRFRFLDYAEIDRQAREAGYPENWRRTDEEREALRRILLAGREHGDVWVFGYGSLMWDPGFYFDEVRVGRLEGYERRFCLQMDRGRGSPETPGLMAALDQGSHCDGLVFRIPHELVDAETNIICRRELISYGYEAMFRPIETAEGEVDALIFTADRTCDRYAGPMEAEESARRIALAKGITGTNIDYLDNLAAQLKVLKLEDAALFDLHERTRKYL